jgi:hypothetical protein
VTREVLTRFKYADARKPTMKFLDGSSEIRFNRWEIVEFSTSDEGSSREARLSVINPPAVGIEA